MTTVSTIVSQARLTIIGLLRDRVLYAILAVALLLVLLVPVFSSFSMRQVQELAITLSLSTISVVLLILAALLGASSIWRDIERRYTTSILTLPISRSNYVLGRFVGIASFMLFSATVLAIISVVVILLSAAQYQSTVPIHWGAIAVAIAAHFLKYSLLLSIAMLISSFSTSFFLPFFATIAIYLAGSASQEVYEFISGDFAKKLSQPILILIKAIYYLVPNFSAFDFNVYAIYGLPISGVDLSYTLAYFIIYTFVALIAAVSIFNRRELP